MRNLLKRIFSSLLGVALILSTFAITDFRSVAAEESINIWDGTTKTKPSGDGTADDPYIIANAENLAYVIANWYDAGKHFKITDDIYLNDISKINWKTGEVTNGYTPNQWLDRTEDGTVEAASLFHGTIDGGNHTIYGLYYNGDNICGLIPMIAGGDTKITNLGIDCAYINTPSYASAMIAWSYAQSGVTKKAEISNCYIGENVTVKGSESSAFVGHGNANVTVDKCYSLATLVSTAANESRGMIYVWEDSNAINISNSYIVGAPVISAYRRTLTCENVYSSINSFHGIYKQEENMQGMDALTNTNKMSGLAECGAFEATDYYPVLKSFPQNQVTITLDTNGGVTDNYTLTVTPNTTVELPTPERDGYKFKGWYKDSAFSNPAGNIAPTVSTVYYAKWLMLYDVDKSGSINAGDLAALRKALLFDKFVDGEAFSAEAADCNGDGKTDILDLVRLKKVLVNIDIATNPHPASGYSTWERTVSFTSEYTLVKGENTYPDEGDPYFEIKSDSNATDNSVLHYYNHSGSSEWKPNWCFTPTVTGDCGTEDSTDNNILPVDTEFKITLRVRINDTDNGSPKFGIYYGSTNGRNSCDYSTDIVDLIDNITKTDGFVTMEAYFTTPKAYSLQVNGKYANRLYMGIYAPGRKLNYDLDYVKIEKVTETSLYVKKDGKFEKISTLSGQPGAALDLPQYLGDEQYSETKPTGGYTQMKLGEWYSDSDCTKSAILKYGNLNVDLYCKDVTVNTLAAADNQVMFAGFDTYTQRTEGLNGAVLTKDTCYTGNTSLKAELSAGSSAVFEIKNDFTLDVEKNTSYGLTLAYKADKAATLEIGLASGGCMGEFTSLKSVSLFATDGWATIADTVFETKESVDDNSVLACRLTSQNGAVVYVDTVVISKSVATADLVALNAGVLSEAADIASTYVYFPKGTVFPSDITNTVTTYSAELNYRNTPTETSALSGDTLTEAAYVKFSQRPDLTKIRVPSDLAYLVHSGTVDELYYGINIKTVTEKLNSVAGENTVNYIFITDIHYNNEDYLVKQSELAVKAANENDNIDFVVIGGDITTGMFTTKQACIDAMHTVLKPFENCEKPVFVLMGNHDDNSYALDINGTFDLSLVLSDKDWNSQIIDKYVNNNITVVQDKDYNDSKYYYYDLESKKTRIIALDALDYRATYDENGTVTNLPLQNANAATDYLKYYCGRTYWGYSEKQIKWLAETALGTLPEGYDVVFLSHMGIDDPTNAFGSKVHYGTELRKVIEAFNNGKTYGSVRFNTKSGKIISYQFGHQHIELSNYESDLNLWQVCTSTASVVQRLTDSNVNDHSLPWRYFERSNNTATEAAFNVMSVSRKRIYRFAVGQGMTEKLIYPN